MVSLGTGPVTYRSHSKRSLFVSDIDALRASGGGDCPELAFTGMLNALEEGPEYGSPMFVFTDASAKDANSLNKAALKASADLSDITITFFTNLNGCSATDGIKDFEEIARHTEGKSTSSLIRTAYTLPGKIIVPEADLGMLQHPRWSSIVELYYHKELHLGCCSIPRSASESCFYLKLAPPLIVSMNFLKLYNEIFQNNVLNFIFMI